MDQGTSVRQRLDGRKCSELPGFSGWRSASAARRPRLDTWGGDRNTTAALAARYAGPAEDRATVASIASKLA